MKQGGKSMGLMQKHLRIVLHSPRCFETCLIQAFGTTLKVPNSTENVGRSVLRTFFQFYLYWMQQIYL